MKTVEGLRYKRTLFVGLGGAGSKTLRELKKKISAANNGKIPEQVKFLLIDTNATELANFRDFDCSEKICIAVREPYQRYKHDKDAATHEMIPKQNTHSLLALERGAGQVRSNGHFAVIESQYSNKLMRLFREKADEIANIDVKGKDLERDPKIEVRLVFSLAGGTGSGTFLPISMLLRAAIKQCELTAYIYSATHYEWFVENSAKNSVMQNAYAALAELDYMMHFGRKDRRYSPVRFNFGPEITQQMEQSNRPFEEVYFIDKRTALPTSESIEFAYNEQKRLQENTADTMHIAATNIISSHTGTVDNVRQKIMEGQFDVGDKFAWVSGVGLAEIYLNRLGENDPNVVNICNAAISARINNELELPETVIDVVATAFIQKYKWDESKGKEDNDPILSHFASADSILRRCQDRVDKQNEYNASYRDFNLSLDDILVSYQTNSKSISDKLKENFNEYITTLLRQLINEDSFNNKYVSGYNGKGHGLSFKMIQSILDKISDKLEASKTQLKEEKKQHEEKRDAAEKRAHDERQNNVPANSQRRSVWQRIFSSSTTNEPVENLSTDESVKVVKDDQIEALVNNILSERVEKAITVFDQCQDIISEMSDNLNKWRDILVSAYNYGKHNQMKIEHKDEDSERKENKVEVQMMDIQEGFRLKYDDLKHIYSETIKNITISEQAKFQLICQLLEKTSGSLQAYLAAGLKELKKVGEDSRNQIERTECQKKIDRLIDLSTPTMQIDRHGYGDQVKADQFWYIMTECDAPQQTKDCATTQVDDSQNEKEKTVGELLKQFIEQNTLGDKVNLIHVPGWKDKAILYRVISAIPVYFVEGVCESELGGHTLEGCYEEMKKQKRTYTPFSHEILRRKLENAIGVLKPYDSTSEEVALEYWVNIQLLSQNPEFKKEYIYYLPPQNKKELKRTEGTYSILSEKAGEYLTTELKDRKKILLLGESRLDAYETFCRYCKVILEEHPDYKDLTDAILNPERYERLFIMSAEEYMDIVLPNWRKLHYENDDPEFLLLKKEMNYIDKRKQEYETKQKKEEGLGDIVQYLEKENNIND